MQEERDTNRVDSYSDDCEYTPIPARRSSRNELEEFEGGARDGNDVQERETFPPGNPTVGYLLVSPRVRVGKDNQADNDPHNSLRFLFGVNSWYPDANACVMDMI